MGGDVAEGVVFEVVGDGRGVGCCVVVGPIADGALVVGEGSEDVTDGVLIGENLIDAGAVQVAVQQVAAENEDQSHAGRWVGLAAVVIDIAFAAIDVAVVIHRRADPAASWDSSQPTLLHSMLSAIEEIPAIFFSVYSAASRNDFGSFSSFDNFANIRPISTFCVFSYQFPRPKSATFLNSRSSSPLTSIMTCSQTVEVHGQR